MKRTRDEAQGNDAFPGQEVRWPEPQREEVRLPKHQRAPASLPWIRHPVRIPVGEDDVLGVPGMQSRLRSALTSRGFDKLFAVQAATWKHTGGGTNFERDLCVCAPTGSGKTLAYALPLVQGLTARTNKQCVRALVVVPTGDLAMQVAQVFSPLCEAFGLRVGVAWSPGASAGGSPAHLPLSVGRDGLLAKPLDTNYFKDMTGISHQRSTRELGHHTDVLVTPPGRLAAYIRDTENFSLSEIEYLVVDEADRILRQSYQGWLPLVMSAAGSQLARTTIGERRSSFRRLKKMLFSATLTRDPSRLSALQLHAPQLLTAVSSDLSRDERYLLPDRLEEHVIMTEVDDKPLALCALLHKLGRVPVIIFTSSVDATHRLYLFLNSMDRLPSSPVEYSSFASQARRTDALQAFKCGFNLLLVASDAATRGLDVDHVSAVISYDTPTHLKTYVHRVGRTARGGRRGSAYTLCRPAEESRFDDMLSKLEGQVTRPQLKRLLLTWDELQVHKSRVRAALIATKLTLEAGLMDVRLRGGATGVSAPERVACSIASLNFRSSTQ